MPHDVTMPQLGMAQDAGKIVSWLKAPGDPVAKGDALFEVETDKATMEVEAQADGFLTGVVAGEGEDVPVGSVIARISESAEDDAPAAPAPTAEAAPANDLPEGKTVTMPQLGMAQDTGLLVSWQKAPGDAVAADDVLFEVETDKSTMEVPAGIDGFLAATLAQAGEEVPVGDPVAIISDAKPDSPVARSVADSAAAPAPAPAAAAAPAPAKPEAAAKAPAQAPKPQVAVSRSDRILASPKARRLAAEQGLDLARLAKAGHPQPYHVKDIEVLRALPSEAPTATAAASARRLVAEVAEDGLPGFQRWMSETHGLGDADAILAGLAGASLAAGATVAIERAGLSRSFATSVDRTLSGVAETEDAPDLILRDLRGSPLRSVEMGAGPEPVLTLTNSGAGLTITLECDPASLSPQAAIQLLTDFAGRVEQPLRHLL